MKNDSQILTHEEVKARARNSYDNGFCYISGRPLAKNEQGEWVGVTVHLPYLALIEDKFWVVSNPSKKR